ncbi:MAG TPA: AAA family ATPase, partial [Chloroflexota bacterium]|nr:AAA family ATPase [Chloroflexota bacterium]
MALASPLLETKLFVPRPRRSVVPRPRLIERLNGGVEVKLVLVSAPPGFGKTTLLAEWLASSGRAAAWLSLDQADNHAQSFWSYVVAALRTVQPDIGAGAMALLQSPQPPPTELLLATLLNELQALPRDVVLVLDDYHVIDDTAIHDGTAFLLDRLPSRLHLAIVSRTDPPLSLARLRARGELLELRAADLRFSSDEAATYLNESMGLHLEAKDLATLEARTEGWIAALQLAALSLQRRDDAGEFIAGFAGDDRYIVDYLVEEVLQRQPEQVRRLLLRTSILDRLSGAVCDAVTGQSGGKAMLEGLDRGNLFVVALDDRRRWYRYHHLFADVLRAHLAEEQPDEVADLHRRASAWFADNDDPGRAIQHALAAPDYQRAADLIEHAARATLRSYRPAALIEWLAALPADLISTRPVLAAYYAFALLGLGELDVAESLLHDAERCLNGESKMVVAEEAEVRSVPGMIALARAFRAQALGDVATTLELGRQALDRFPESDHVWRAGAGVLLALAHWIGGDLATAQLVHDAGVADLERSGDIRLAISAVYDGAELRKARGRLSEAKRAYERTLELAQAHGGSAMPGVGDLHLGLSDLYREWNDLPTAHGHLLRGEELGRQLALPQTPARMCVARARLLQLDGDLDGALDLLVQAERLELRGPVPETRPVGSLKARLWLAQGRLAEAHDWAHASALSLEDNLDYPREFAHITLARVLLAADRDVRAFLERLLGAAEAGGRNGSSLEILVLLARAHHQRRDMRAALSTLEGALLLAEPEGYVRLFIDEGEPMRDLLRHAVAAGVSGTYAQRLVSALHEPARAVPVAGLAEPLTAREVEILRLVAVGMRNQEIADQLVIS